MEEMPKTTTIPVEGTASLSMHDIVAEAARVEEIRAETASQTKG
jgi:hypothetical protein